MKKQKHIPYSTSTIVAIFTLFMLSNCNSAKRVAHKRNDFLLNCRTDTLKISASELSIRDSSIIPCLDTLIADTKKLGEYDKRIAPLFWISFNQLKDTALVCVESDFSYESFDLETLFGDANWVPKPDYEVLIYKDVKFIVRIYNDDSTGKLERIKESYLERNQKHTHFDAYRFYRADGKIMEFIAPVWWNEIEFSYIDHHLYYRRKKYHPINRPFGCYRRVSLLRRIPRWV